MEVEVKRNSNKQREKEREPSEYRRAILRHPSLRRQVQPAPGPSTSPRGLSLRILPRFAV